MRISNRLTLSITTSSVALLSAFACSSDPAENGGNGTVPDFGNQPGAGGSDSAAPGGAGSTGAIPGGGGAPGTGEGQGGTQLNAGQSGSTGVGMGGATEVVDAPVQETPRGYFASGSWRGFGWTGVDDQGLATTSPADFSELPPEAPFCFEGTITADPPSPNANDGYQGVALLGFNINQELTGATEGTDAPVLEAVPTQTGVAVNFQVNPPPANMANATVAPVQRIQLQNNAGTTWCADLTSPTGSDFVLYQQDPARPTVPFFRTNCWEPVTSPDSQPYALEPISAVVLTVPGGGEPGQDFYYNICVAGFADGNSAADAPTSISLGEGVLTGTIATEAGKRKVTVDGESYVINNNAWGVNSGNGTQEIRFVNNSFEVLRQVAGPGGDGSPASFPSIYIGANGAQSGVNGATTTDTDNLPIQVSAIASIPTTFRHSGPLGDNNAAYDVWFASSPPAGEYETAQAAFLMVWTHRPGNRFPIGTNNVAFQTGQEVQGVAGTWDLWIGRRGGNGPDADFPVINYVAPNTIRNFSADLNLFIQDAVQRSQAGQLNGFTFSNQLYLTDVFAGFEIWSGGAGLRVDEFTAVVNP